MTALLSSKDDEIALLKTKLVVVLTEGPSSNEVVELKAKFTYLSTKVANLKDQLLNHHMESNSRSTLVVQSLTQNPHLPLRFQNPLFLVILILFCLFYVMNGCCSSSNEIVFS